MAENSTMIPLGSLAPDFYLWDAISEKKFHLTELTSDKGTVIMFICNHCPYVKWILPKLVELCKAYQSKGIAFIAINANDAERYPEDGPVAMHELGVKYPLPFPYLYDETQETAKAYRAACTPDFYVFDGKCACVYRGRFDDATPKNNRPVTGSDLADALERLLSKNHSPSEQKPSIGCSIKWKS